MDFRCWQGRATQLLLHWPPWAVLKRRTLVGEHTHRPFHACLRCNAAFYAQLAYFLDPASGSVFVTLIASRKLKHPQVEFPEVKARDAENPAATPSRGSVPQSNSQSSSKNDCISNSNSKANKCLLLPRVVLFIWHYSYARPEAAHDKTQALLCTFCARSRMVRDSLPLLA